MPLLSDLRRGTHGIRFTPPSHWGLDTDQDTFASFRDTAHRVDWYLEFSPLIVDLSIRHDAVLRDDLRLDTIAVFESYCEMARQESGSPSPASVADQAEAVVSAAERIRALPRTRREPTWSPVVSVERATFAEVPVLVVVHRLTYAPGDELIIGRIVIPLEQGTLYFGALRRANETGVRESVLSIINSSSSQDGGGIVSQAEIDSPALDEKFPDHPLSVIRRALRWALTTPLDITVMAPLPLECDETVELPNVGCRLRIPPRFRFCPAIAAKMDRSLTPFTRATVPQAGSYAFDVWCVPSVKITGPDALARLRSFAEEHVRGWRKEGDADFELESGECPLPDGRLGVKTFVRFCVDGHLNHAVANWFTDQDGTVFRLCAAGTVSRSREELTSVVDDSTVTWRRLPGDLKKLSKWWDVFSR